MRILNLAKELGISYESLLDWIHRAHLPYSNPEDELTPAHEQQIRRIYSAPRSSPGEGRHKKESDLDMDRRIEDALEPWSLETDIELPETLEELEDLERSLVRSLPGQKARKPSSERLSTKRFLENFGLRGKSTLKRLRKLLPGDAARLVNQPDLSEAQQAKLQTEIETRAVFVCDHPFCRKTSSKRHSPELLFLVNQASLCHLCRGSATRRSLEEAAEACREAGMRRILVVGGMPASHTEIDQNAPPGLEFRLVAGDLERQRQRVQADLRWCDLAIIWGSTILGHSLSSGYLSRKGDRFIIRVQRRSIEALCAEVVRHLEGRKSS